jgi:hypothetical protein
MGEEEILEGLVEKRGKGGVKEERRKSKNQNQNLERERKEESEIFLVQTQ